jgi:hypothetical protein
MNMDDSTNGPPIVWRSAVPRYHRLPDSRPPPEDETPDDGDTFALMPPAEQTIWPRVWPGL